MSSSKALRTVRPPKPESNTPMVGRRERDRWVVRGCSALIHLIPREVPSWLNLRKVLHQLVVRPGPAAARPRRNRRSVRTGPRMAQKRAYLIRRFGRQDVLELTRLLLDLRLAVHR